MQEFGKIRVERDKVTTPNGQIPLNADSTVGAFHIPPISKYTKKAVGVSVLIAGIFSGGAAWILIPAAFAVLDHDSYRIIVTTDGEEFLVTQIGGVDSISSPKEHALELKEAISREIRRLYAARAKSSKAL